MMSGALAVGSTGGSAPPATAAAAAAQPLALSDEDMQELRKLHERIGTRTRARDDLEAEIEAEEAASVAPASAALLSKKQRALELQIKITQDKIRTVELQLPTAPTPEKMVLQTKEAVLQADKAALQADKAALQREKVLLLETQQRLEALQPSAASAASVAAAAAVFVDVHRWDSDEVRNVRLSPSSDIGSLESAVRIAFDVPADQVCKIYYLTDPQRPRQTKQKVHDATSWREFWSTRVSSAEHIGLHLHVTPRAAPGSPDKEPSWLKIDTGVKRANHRQGGTPSSAALAAAATPSSSCCCCTPGDVQTPRSPLLRDTTLYRDFDTEKNQSYCVFCTKCFPDFQLEVVQLIPPAVSERYGLALSPDLMIKIGHYESTSNAVAACRLCHPLFDRGLLWLEPAAAASSVAAASSAAAAAVSVQPPPSSSLVVCVDPSQKNDDVKSLAGRSLRLPGLNRAESLFPPAAAWEWRARWALLKRQDELNRHLKKLSVSGPGPCDSKECKKQRNAGCTLRMCQSCCLKSPLAVQCNVNKHNKPATPLSAR